MFPSHDRSAYEYLGYISNLRILKDEALYTAATYTVPTTPFTPVANTVLLTCQNKTFEDSSNSSHVISREGNAYISEFGPFGDGYWGKWCSRYGISGICI